MVKSSRNLLYGLAVVFLNAACIHEGLDDCITTALVYITVSQGEGSTLSNDAPGNVDNTTVYIFDADLKLERAVQMSREDLENRKPIELTYINGRRPTVVAWGNLNNSQDVTPPTPGMLLSSGRISLLTGDDGYTLPPDDLYHGLKELTTENVQEVFIKMWVGRITIAVHGIEDIRNMARDFFFTIESNYNGYDFYGVSQEGNAVMQAEGEVNEQQNEFLTHQPVNMVVYPSPENADETIVVKLYRRTDSGNQLVAAVDTDIRGNTIEPQPGMNTNVLINLTEHGTIEVEVKVTPWEYIYQWVLW